MFISVISFYILCYVVRTGAVVVV